MSIKLYSVPFIFLLIFSVSLHAKTITILLDPAGDAKTTGRQLHDSFERGVTVQCATRLQQEIIAAFPFVKVMLTRLPGETVHELQNAQFANRMNVDLYISIHFFQEKNTVPSWYFYSMAQADDCILKPTELALYRTDQIHLLNQARTNDYVTLFRQTLINSPYKKNFTYHALMKVPFKPLLAIKAPAFALEIGLKQSEGWQEVVDPIVHGLSSILKTMLKEKDHYE